MQFEARTFVGFGVAAMLVALSACSAAPHDEPSAQAGEAVTRMPEASCTLIAGVDTSGLQSGDLQITFTPWTYPITDPNDPVRAFMNAATTAAGGYPRTQITVTTYTKHWVGYDLSHLPATQLANEEALVKQAQWHPLPVGAGVYKCKYNLADYQGTPPSDLPVYVQAFDPSCIKASCSI